MLPTLSLSALASIAGAEHLPQVQRASFSIPDMMFLTVIALIVFGPKKLPEISRQLGKLVFEFRRASNDFKLQIEEELRLSEEAERQKQIAAQAAAAPALPTPVALSSTETTGESSPAEAVSLTDTVESTIEPPQSAETPTIMPPANGTAVSSPPPNRRTGAYTETAPSEFPIEEVQAAVQDQLEAADAAGAPETPSALAAEAGSAATHHG